MLKENTIQGQQFVIQESEFYWSLVVASLVILATLSSHALAKKSPSSASGLLGGFARSSHPAAPAGGPSHWLRAPRGQRVRVRTAGRSGSCPNRSSERGQGWRLNHHLHPIAQMRELSEQMLPALETRRAGHGCRQRQGNRRPGTRTSFRQRRSPLYRQPSHGRRGKDGRQRWLAPICFVKAVCIVTPTPNSPPELVQQLEEFWARSEQSPPG